MNRPLSDNGPFSKARDGMVAGMFYDFLLASGAVTPADEDGVRRAFRISNAGNVLLNDHVLIGTDTLRVLAVSDIQDLMRLLGLLRPEKVMDIGECILCSGASVCAELEFGDFLAGALDARLGAY